MFSGNGIRELRDNNANTFWQSDSLSPHTITLHFSQTLPIARVDLLINLQQDESYTPTVVQIKIGMSGVHEHILMQFMLNHGNGFSALWWLAHHSAQVPYHALSSNFRYGDIVSARWLAKKCWLPAGVFHLVLHYISPNFLILGQRCPFIQDQVHPR